MGGGRSCRSLDREYLEKMREEEEEEEEELGL